MDNNNYYFGSSSDAVVAQSSGDKYLRKKILTALIVVAGLAVVGTLVFFIIIRPATSTSQRDASEIIEPLYQKYSYLLSLYDDYIGNDPSERLASGINDSFLFPITEYSNIEEVKVALSDVNELYAVFQEMKDIRNISDGGSLDSIRSGMSSTITTITSNTDIANSFYMAFVEPLYAYERGSSSGGCKTNHTVDELLNHNNKDVVEAASLYKEVYCNGIAIINSGRTPDISYKNDLITAKRFFVHALSSLNVDSTAENELFSLYDTIGGTSEDVE